ncbi:ALP1-like protein isoform X1 [Tanacetum coccineum]
MDPNNLNDFDTTNTYDHYDAFFQPDYDRYMRDYESYQHYMSLCEQEAGGSSSGPIRRRRYIYREREEAEERLIDDYFGDDEYEPKYPEETFRRRYRMSSTLFNKIVNDILSYDVQPIPEYFTYFSSRLDATGRKSIGPILKCTSAIRQLAYGTAPDAFDEYLQIAERTSRECLDNFTKCIHVLYNHKFLRRPSATDIEKTYKLHEEKHGLPGMLGSIDCMHWDWKNCPKSLHGQFKRRDHKYPTLMLEAVADQRLWIWHAYFGVPGANNDLNVLYGSPLFDDEIADIAPECPFIVNGHTYRKCYYLADGIYPEWSTFVKTFSVTRDAKTFKFKTVQEAARKDIERAFGLGDNTRDFATGNKFTFVKLLQCVPLIEFLVIGGLYMKHLSAGGMPHKLPTSLDQLKCLSLAMCYDEEHEVSSALCLIRSSPNLEKFDLTGYDKSDTTQISKKFPDIQDYSGFALDHLEFFWVEYFTNEDRQVDFLKLIMAKSPMLKKAQIELFESVSLEEENELLKDLLQLPFPRASPSAKLVFQRPKSAS